MRTKIVVASIAVAMTIPLGGVAVAQQPPEEPQQEVVVVPPRAPSIVGFYLCEGMGSYGKPYEGLVQISQVGATYRLRWKTANGGVGFGIGVLAGDTLAITYFGKMPSVVVYHIRELTGQLIGEWATSEAEGEVFPEVLTRVADSLQPTLGPEKPPEPEPQPPFAGGLNS